MQQVTKVTLVQAKDHPKKDEIQDVNLGEAQSVEFRSLVQGMVDLAAANGGVGLAAPQCGIPLRLFVVNVGRRWEVYCNVKYKPAIKAVLKDGIEQCLTLPGESYMVKRWDRVVCEGKILTTSGRFVTWKETIDGSYARVFQHEASHCWGQLISHIGKKVENASFK